MAIPSPMIAIDPQIAKYVISHFVKKSNTVSIASCISLLLWPFDRSSTLTAVFIVWADSRFTCSAEIPPCATVRTPLFRLNWLLLFQQFQNCFRCRNTNMNNLAFHGSCTIHTSRQGRDYIISVHSHYAPYAKYRVNLGCLLPDLCWFSCVRCHFSSTAWAETVEPYKIDIISKFIKPRLKEPTL